MGGVLDDCGLRFLQRWRRPPQNTPDFGGPTDFFDIFEIENLSKKTPRPRWRSIYTRPTLCPPLLESQVIKNGAGFSSEMPCAHGGAACAEGSFRARRSFRVRTVQSGLEGVLAAASDGLQKPSLEYERN